MRRFALISAVIFVCALLRAQPQYEFRMLDASGGLPENNVRDMLMLPDGLMCIQTTSYLCFFDGAACRNYRWDPVRVPYAEYSGQNRLAYDPETDRVLLHTRDRSWAFDRATQTFLYDVPQPAAPDDGEPAGLFPEDLSSRTETAESSDGRRWFMSDKHIILYPRRDN